MNVVYHGLSNDLLISPYTTAQEKDMLLVQEYSTDIPFVIREFLNILGLQRDFISTLSLDDCKALLYKYREISLGEEIDIKYICPNCGNAVSATISCANVVTTPESTGVVKNLRRVPNDFSDFMDNFLSVSPDTMSIKEFEHLFNHAKEFQTLYNFKVKMFCPLCHKETFTDLSRDSFVIKAMSEDSLKSIYQAYEVLIHHGNWTKTGIDTLLPFERKIFISLLMNSLEKKSRVQR